MLFNVISGSLKGPNNYNSSLSKKPVSFGCRMVAFATPSAGKPIEQDTFIRSCLKDSSVSLKNQSKPRPNFEDGYTKPFSIRGFVPDRGNADGWGILDYVRDKISTFNKGSDPAYESTNFDKTVEKVIEENPNIILAHIYSKSVKLNPVPENHVNPFVYGNWSFMCNGFFDIEKSGIIKERLNAYKTKYNLGPENIQNVAPDGIEACFYYFLGKMKDKGIDLNSTELDVNDIQKVFAETINDLNNTTKISSKKRIPSANDILGPDSELHFAPSMNFVTSNGKMLLASRTDATKLYVGVHYIFPDLKEYVISSEPIQPDNNPKAIKWLELPPDTIFTLVKNNDNNLIPRLLPLWKALESSS